MKRKHIKILPYIYLMALLLATVLPFNTGDDSTLTNTYTLNIRWDYLLHALVYLPVTLLIRIRKNNLWLPLLIGVAIACGLEALQILVPYRSFNINDLVANGVGVMLGWILMVFAAKKIPFA